MVRGAIRYKDHGLLMPGSRAHELFLDKTDKGHKQLDQHMAELDRDYQKLVGRPAPRSPEKQA